jgi:hypothetical protein
VDDHWEFFPCQMGDERAFIFVDVGGDSTVAGAPTRLVKLRLQYHRPHPDGLPTNEEYDAVIAIENELEAFVKEGADRYVGRVTVGGHRYFYFYTSRNDFAWRRFIGELAARSGYELTPTFCDDPEYAGYWRDLFPGDDDWRVIYDMKVIEGLETHGDDGTAPRQIDHWIYFPAKGAVMPFIAWAESNGFVHDPQYSHEDDDGRYCVRVHHEGPASIESVSHHTIALRRKAAELGGDYDGWETPVIKPGDVTSSSA